MNAIKGLGVALVTPFEEDGQIDFEGLKNLVNFQKENGVDYLVVLGTTAEAATLSLAEKKEVIGVIVKENAGQLPLVLGLGGNNTAELIDQLEREDFSDFDAILSVSPYYNRPSQEGIYQHFAKIAKHSPLPIVLYNVPSRTGSNMTSETTVRLANDFDNIVAIKEASGDLNQAMRILRDAPKDFLVLSGDDAMALPIIMAGGHGVISVIGEGIPEVFSKLIHYGLEGKFDLARKAQFNVLKIIDLIFEEGNPAGIKSLLETRGVCSPYTRLPLVKASDQLKEKIRKEYLAISD